MKKILTSLCISLIFIFNVSFAYTKIYDMKTTKVPVASGVIYQNLKRLTTGGWLNINILEVDLTNDNVKLDMLTPSNGIYNLETVRNQSETANAVAAVNADFFSWDTSVTGYPIGFGIKNGEILSSAYYKNKEKDTMATFLLSDANIPYYNYVKMEEMKVSNKNGESMDIAEINKISNDYLLPVLFNTYFGETSPGNSKLWDTVEFVIADDKLVEVRDCREGATIPENGYVICARENNAYLLRNMFNIGDKVELSIKTNIDLDKMITAVSGGGMLVENGVANDTFSHDISGYQPRTAVGSSEDGKTLYMVTVDGRGISKGVTQVELAYLMNEIGCYNAVNLDGGGSTIMLGRLAGTSGLSTLNIPSATRKVTDSLGVISTAPKSGTLEKLKLSATYEQIFKNYSTELSISAYDEYINPVTVDMKNVRWTVSGVKGKVSNRVFTPTTAGIAKLTATYKGVSESIEIRVLDEVAEIVTESREINLAKGQKYTLPIKVRDVEGYGAIYSADDLEYTTSNDNCSVDKNAVITANNIGSTLVTIHAGNTAKSFVKVNVSGSYDEVVDDFEKMSVSFRSYPSEDVSGKAELSSKSYKGDKSLKLDFDFTGTTATRGAYAVFNEPPVITEDVTMIKLHAYSNKEYKNILLKFQIEDSTGTTKLVTVSSGLDCTKWKEYQLQMDGVQLPAKLERIYVAELEGKKGVDSSIYIDNLIFSKTGTSDNITIILPKNTKPVDLTQTESDKVDEDTISFMFYGDATNDGTLYELLKINALNEITKETDFAILGAGELENVEEQIALNGKYSFYEEGEVGVLKLANSGKGLLATYQEQWNWMVSKLNSTDVKNLLILMPSDVESSFTDEQEKILFKQVIKEYKEKNKANVTFLTVDEETGFSMFEGQKTITAGIKKYDSVRGNVYNDNYILFTLNKDKLTYQILNIFE